MNEILLDQIVEYIQQQYKPLSVILYGSYSNGTNDDRSDFDALVISSDHEEAHDTSILNGIQLDVFVYPVSYFEKDYDRECFIQIFDGKTIIDCNDIGKKLISDIRSYLQARPPKTRAEIQSNIDWCVKMLSRARRYDYEGLFRWHWVLVDSLEFFCDIMKQPYLGPKKTLRWMEKAYPLAFECYGKALRQFEIDRLEEWIMFMKNAWETQISNT